MTGQREQIALGAARLVTRRGDLTRIERDRAQRQAALATATSDATLRLDRLAREAQDLRELLDTLAAAKKRRDDEERAKRAAEPAIASPPAPEPGPPAPDFSPLVAELKPISEARGTLPFPVVGSVTQLYGEAEDAAGVRSKGITIKTRAAAQVIAPFDGVVAFAGPFRAYGLLLIIEHSEGYHTLLAGLGRVDRTVGQRVLAGEPVGAMDGDGEPSLYVELRRDGQPMNPLPWLANRTGKSSG
jgi:septal ring factor EnvC (AmiA/AmiB activator)